MSITKFTIQKVKTQNRQSTTRRKFSIITQKQPRAEIESK